jgi:hypothetical protein
MVAINLPRHLKRDRETHPPGTKKNEMVYCGKLWSCGTVTGVYRSIVTQEGIAGLFPSEQVVEERAPASRPGCAWKRSGVYSMINPKSVIKFRVRTDADMQA